MTIGPIIVLSEVGEEPYGNGMPVSFYVQVCWQPVKDEQKFPKKL